MSSRDFETQAPELDYEPELVPLTDREVAETLARNEKHQAQLLAEERVPAAFETLDRVMADPEGPNGAAVTAARTVIEHATGRPGQKKPTAGGDGQGLVINILQLGEAGGATKRVLAPVKAIVDQAFEDADETPFGD